MRVTAGIIFFCLVLYIYFEKTYTNKYGPDEKLKDEADERAGLRLKTLLYDIITDTDRRVKGLSTLRVYVGYQNPYYEMGYINFIMVDKYRKMVDLYNYSLTADLFLMEHVLNLKEIEHLYFEIHHLGGMLHEIERKYNIVEPLDKEFTTRIPLPGETDATTKHRPGAHPTGKLLAEQVFTIPTRSKKTMKKTPGNMKGWMTYIYMATKKKKSTRWWWPLEYGWEIDYWWG